MKTKAFKTREDDHINRLCDRIREETDYVEFSALVRELNETLKRRDLRSKLNNPQTKKVA
jgi:hypothetical protein